MTGVQTCALPICFPVTILELEEPDSGRGRKYKVVVVDEAEKAKKLKEA